MPARSFNARKLIAFVAMVFGMFMAILDIQIVSASLAEIQAGLSASADEISWVQTSLPDRRSHHDPAVGHFCRARSRPATCSRSRPAGFTLMSFMCATPSIGEMIVWRALQGFIGGAMIPTVFAAALHDLPARETAGRGSPVIGLVATLAPTIGPTIGGYLTDVFSWHWLFLVNVVPGIVGDASRPGFSSISTSPICRCSKFRLDRARSPWRCFSAASNTCSRRGRRTIGSTRTAILLWHVVVSRRCARFLLARVHRQGADCRSRAFTDRNFATGCLFPSCSASAFTGLTYIYPVYLARVRGYYALMIGETMFVTGPCHVHHRADCRPAATKLDPRIMIAFGFAGFALGTWQAS